MYKLHIRKKGHGRFTRAAAALAAAVMFVFAAPAVSPYVGAVDVYQFAEDGFYYTINAVSGTIEASIVGYDASSGKGGSLTIPVTLGGYPVTSIGPEAFAGQTVITGVSVPSNIKTIGAGAFQNCTALTTVNIAAGVTEISENTFKGCTLLNAASIPATVNKIGASAFENCTSLKSLTLAEGVTQIGKYAFRRCGAITAVTMPNSLAELGEGAFEECTGITEVKFSPALTSIADFTFYKCSALKSVNLTENIISIGRYAFAECPGITSLSFPRSVTTIGASAFENCRSLAVVIIPHTTETISSTAFSGAPVSIYGYTGTYAQEYAHRNNIPFTSYGAVYAVTFSSNITYATVENISIKSKNGTIIPPSTVLNDEELSITATAPPLYKIDRIVINGEPFTNGSTYRVHNNSVGITVYYKLEADDEPETQMPEDSPPATVPTSQTTSVTTVTTSRTSATTTTTSATTTTTAATTTTPATSRSTTSGTTEAPATTPSTDNTTAPPEEYTTDPDVTVNSDLTDSNGVKVRISAPKENFIGPVVVRVTNTDEAAAKCDAAAIASGFENVQIYPFDISLLDVDGHENSGILAKGSITFMIPVPNQLLPYIPNIRVYHVEDGRAVLINSSIIEDINGVKRVRFDADSFSPYMFVSDDDETISVIEDPGENETPVPQQTTNSGAEATIVDNNTPKPSNNGSRNPFTGQVIAIGIPSAALVSALLVKKGRSRRKRAKSDIE